MSNSNSFIRSEDICKSKEQMQRAEGMGNAQEPLSLRLSCRLRSKLGGRGTFTSFFRSNNYLQLLNIREMISYVIDSH